MGAGGDLRHHAAERAMLLPLRAHDVRQDAATAIGTRARRPPPPSRRSSSRCRARAVSRAVCVRNAANSSPSAGYAFAMPPADEALKRRSGHSAPRALPPEDRHVQAHPQPAAERSASARAARRWRCAQAHETRRGLMAAHGFAEDRFEIVVIKTSGRPHPGPAAVRGRRQGPVHQGDRRSAVRRRASTSPCIR